MSNFAAYTWFPSHAPVNIAFTQLATFGGSGFPPAKLNHAYVTESGPTYAPGPAGLGKRITEFVLDGAGNLIGGPTPLVEYIGAGRGTAVALAAGPDGLYFSDLYKNFGASNPTEAGASVFRVSWTGTVDFTGDVAAGARAADRPVPRRVERARSLGVALGVRRRHVERREGARARLQLAAAPSTSASRSPVPAARRIARRRLSWSWRPRCGSSSPPIPPPAPPPAFSIPAEGRRGLRKAASQTL